MLSQAFYTLDVPPAPAGSPEYLERLLARLQASTDADEPRAARESLRDTMGFLTRYFGVVLSATADRLGLPPLEGEGTRHAEQVMANTLGPLLKSADPMAVALRSVFFREQQGGEYLPFPHTRLLLRDGWLASGAHTLTEWLNTSCEPESDDSCREEVDSLLPVLSQWLGAAGPFFRECRYDYQVSPRHDFQTVGLRGLEGGRRVPMQRVQLMTRFGDLLTGLPMRTRDMEPIARPSDAEPLAELVREMLRTNQTESPKAVEPATAPAAPRRIVTESPAPRKNEFDFLLTAAPIAAAAVLGYMFMLAL